MTPLVKRLQVSPKNCLNLISLISLTNINDVFPPYTYIVSVIILYVVLAFNTILCQFVPFKINIIGENLNDLISFHFMILDLLIVPLASATSAFYMNGQTLLQISWRCAFWRTGIKCCSLTMTVLILVWNVPIFLNNGPEDHVWNSFGITTYPSYDYFQHVLLFVTAICLPSEASVIAQVLYILCVIFRLVLMIYYPLYESLEACGLRAMAMMALFTGNIYYISWTSLIRFGTWSLYCLEGYSAFRWFMLSTSIT